MTELKVGDTVRIKKSDRLVELDDINDNPNYVADDEYWASGWYLDGSGTADIQSPDDVTPETLKPIPTAHQIAEQISSDMHGGWGDVVSITETVISGNTIETFARTPQGVGVAFLVTVHQVEREAL